MAETDKTFGIETETENTFNKEEWIKHKQEMRTLAYEMLNTATEDINNVDDLMAYLDVQSRFDKYSVSNALLVAYQCPEAKRICDSKTWQKHKVFIEKGQSGIIILEPGKPYDRTDGTTGVSYNAKKVFDISQTTAKDRSVEPKAYDIYQACVDIQESSPVDIEISNDLPDNTNVVYQPTVKKIFIRTNLDEKTTFKGLAKEIAFARLDNGGFSRNDLDFKASSVAYILCTRVGIEPDPIKSMDKKFLKLENKEKRKELSTVRDNANSITNTIMKSRNEREVNNRTDKSVDAR